MTALKSSDEWMGDRVNFGDDVAALQAFFLGGAAFGDIGDDDPLRIFQFKFFAQLLGQRLDRQAKGALGFRLFMRAIMGSELDCARHFPGLEGNLDRLAIADDVEDYLSGQLPCEESGAANRAGS